MNISAIVKYIDQPVVVHNWQKKMPLLLAGGGGTFALNDTFRRTKKDKNHREQIIVKNSIVAVAAMVATMIGSRGLKINGHKIFGGLLENKPIEKILKNQSHAVDHYLEKSGDLDKGIVEILDKARTGKLSPDNIETLTKTLPHSHSREHLFHDILGTPMDGHCCGHNHEDFKKIWELSALGLIPVAGGVGGGMLADKVTKTSSKESTANKLKEGLFQFLANIALCNVGAAITLGVAKILEHKHIIKPLSRLQKMGVLLTGVIGAGIVGGSAIANHVSKKIINPAFGSSSEGKLYGERKPEALDIALHVDDVSAAGVVSGFKWIEPVIPLFYFVSGYRAGTGYRNGKTSCPHTHIHIFNHFQNKNMNKFANGSNSNG